jgi:hypothetical protein
LRTVIGVKARDYDLQLEIVEVASGRVVASSRERCNLCGVAEAAQVAAAQSGALVQKLEASAKQPATLALTSRPSRMTVEVDGVVIGQTPLRHKIAPGKHRIRVFGQGYVAQLRDVQAVKGVHEALEFTLSAVPPPRQEVPRSRPEVRQYRAAGGVLLGLGGALVITGGVFTALHGRPYRCSGDDVNLDGECRYLYGSLPGGVSMLAVGSAAVITGSVLLIVAGTKQRKRDNRRAKWQFFPAGASIMGSF